MALATPPGRGGIAIVRVSGGRTGSIAAAIVGSDLTPRHAHYGEFKDGQGEPIDFGVAILFPGPASYTGEDVLELHAHGGPVICDALQRRVLELGGRIAEPGEFSLRAYLNDKMDLTQAEAIADLIDSGSRQAARAAVRSLQGEFSAAVDGLGEAIARLRTHVEAAIDFPEEEVDFLDDQSIADQLEQISARHQTLRAAARQGQLLRDGIQVVIAGPPNAGKSSLLNRLAGYAAAIVTDIPGTTRDLLREYLHIDGMPLHVVDTAGLRDDAGIVEREGIRRAQAAFAVADRVLLVIDASQGDDGRRWLNELPGDVAVTMILNKIDLTDAESGVTQHEHYTAVSLSARTGEGLDLLREHLKTVSGYNEAAGGTLSARRRHLQALNATGDHIERAATHLAARAGELLAEELRLAQQSLGEISGAVESEDLLGRIFSSFCIGK